MFVDGVDDKLFQSGQVWVEYNRVSRGQGHKFTIFWSGPGRGKKWHGITGSGYQKPCPAGI